MAEVVASSPQALAEQMLASGARRIWLARPRGRDGIACSHPALAELAGFLEDPASEERGHEAVLLGVGEESRTLFGVFVHQTCRGQAQGGVRHWHYDSVRDFLRDGLRLSLGMGRKCALAGLWWGGGKAIIARRPDDAWQVPGFRRLVYREFAAFVSSLRGCYVTAEDAGTSPEDMAVVQRYTRFVTCIPPSLGGSGNPSPMTARGVVCAMEAALAFGEAGPLAGRTVAMQGAGNVGSAMIEQLLEKGVARIVVAEPSAERRAALVERHPDAPLELRAPEPGDERILAEPCDVLAPNALGGVLGPESIARVRARVVCGAANNPLVDDERDARLLAERGILYVPDFVANRMGIVQCANEHAGTLERDPEIWRHLDGEREDSIQAITRRVLAEAQQHGTTPIAAANRLADQQAQEPHPIWGHRARRILDSLIEGSWAAEG